MTDKIFSVSEINSHIQELIEGDSLLSRVYIRGELSNYKIYPSGHHYFTMKDETGAIKCVMFRSSTGKLKFKPENGMKVIAFGRIALYSRDGAYQLYCNGLTPDGLGDLHLAYEQLKARLYEEGLFDSSHKKPLPEYPQTIAIVTSSAGAAVRDMIRILGKRYPLCKVILLPVRVQGTEAPAEIAGAIRYCNRWGIGDLIITGRGGGSIEDLWAFNDERVARAIYSSEIPVISAVGHEPDVTISDYVADLRAATPSNAAELAVPDMTELRQRLGEIEASMTAAINNRLRLSRKTLQAMAGSRAMQSPENYIADRRMQLDVLQTRLLSVSRQRFNEKRQTYIRLAATLDAISPLKVLARGYSIARTPEGRIIRRVEDAETGDSLVIDLSDGSLDCTVTDRRINHDRK